MTQARTEPDTFPKPDGEAPTADQRRQGGGEERVSDAFPQTRETPPGPPLGRYTLTLHRDHIDLLDHRDGVTYSFPHLLAALGYLEERVHGGPPLRYPPPWR